MTDETESVPGTEPGTEPEAEARAGAKARSLANLRPPFRKGETGNPRGFNGRSKTNEIAAFLNNPDGTEADRTRLQALIERLYQAALRGNVLAGKTLIEYRLGKPAARPDVLAIADHLHRVDRDRAQILFRALALPQSYDLAKVLKILKDTATEKLEFLFRAEQFLEGGGMEDAIAGQESVEEALGSSNQESDAPPPKGEP